MKSTYIVFIISIIAAVIMAIFWFTNPVAWFFQPTQQTEAPASSTAVIGGGQNEDVSVVADNLSVPWGVDFLPSGNLLVTERNGRLLELTPSGDEESVNVIESSEPQGEAGLLGVAVHPEFSENNWIYIYETTEVADGLENRVLRFRYQGGDLSNQTVIIDDIDGAAYHDGGRIDFSPAGYLFITTGDAGVPETAQSTSSLPGKILRLNDDGSVPEANPFGNPIYSYGHRNPQGITWDDSGRLYSTEHGRSGARSGLDEINLIQSGKNYGWPYLEGDEVCGNSNMHDPAWPGDDCQAVSPLRHSGPDITWAPASATFSDGSIFYGGLRGQALYEARIEDSGSEIRVSDVRSHFKNRFGRLRTATLDPSEDYLYLTTSNTDGRGNPDPNDDKLLRVPLTLLD